MDEKKTKGLGLFALIGLVVSSCIGSGIFALTGQLAEAASPGGALLGWLVAGIGFLTLALSLVNLSKKKPELTGIFQYATEGFGPLAGFVSGWGYWLSDWLGSVAFATMMCQTMGYFFPALVSGNNLPCVIVSSIALWAITFLVIRGVENASFLNAIVMVAKIASISIFIIFALFLFNFGTFTADFWGTLHNNAAAAAGAVASTSSFGGIGQQINACMITMMWVFIGIEGATVMSKRAEKKSDVGKATVIGLICLLVIYVGASILPYGYMSYEEIAQLESPAMLYVFDSMAPGWGGAFISIAIIVSILGSWLSFTILPTETSSEMAHEKLLSGSWGKMNKHNAPQFSLIIVGACIQAMLIIDMISADAYTFAFSFATVTIVFTWILCSAYQMKYSAQTKEWGQFAIGLIATLFLFFGTIISGWTYILLACVGYIPGFFFYVKARKDHNKAISKGEWIGMTVFAILAVVALVCMVMGIITI